MKQQFKIGALFLLTASLFYGFAARAQGVMQEERVSYALSLIDAGDGTGPAIGSTKTGSPVTAQSTHVRVKVTVSVPRSEQSSNYGSIPSYAAPARLMFRQHRGPSTAFDGTLALTRDAPYNANGAAATNAYYPMPQADPDKLSITDATKVDYSAVPSGTATSVYESRLALGQAHDPARWESTYVTDAFAVADILAATENDSANLRMLKSLLIGDGTYEWFAASRRGLGSVARISDIQDHGRNMTFRDVRLWTPQGAESNALDYDSQVCMGKYEQMLLASMPLADQYASWQIFRGAVGVNWKGYAGAQLLNVGATQADFSDAARIESPNYPDGVSTIEFEACTTSEDNEIPATLLVQYSTDGGSTWAPTDAETDNAARAEKTVTLKTDFQKFTIDFGDALPEGTAARFRLVRTAQNPTGGSANLFTYVIRNLVVRSAKPTATFSKLEVTVPTEPECADPHEGANFDVSVRATKQTGSPRGYKGTLRLRRRAEGDNSRAWYAVPMTVNYDPTTANATLTASFKPGLLLSNADGSLNVRENAFFTDANGTVTGMLAGVYDVELDCQVLGSFDAGRTDIDGLEASTQTLKGYDVEDTDEEGNPITVQHPYLLNIRERATKAASVFARVMYRTGSSKDNYDLETFDVELLPHSYKKNVWRIDLPKILKMAETSAVYAWGYEPDASSTSEEPKFEPGYLSFKLCAIDKGGNETWYGQNLGTPANSMPPEIKVVPSIAETFKEATTEADAVPIVVAVGGLPNSHLMVELDLTNDAAPTANLAGSFWQDFNTWDVSDSFIKTEFRENVTSVTADFDSTLSTINGETKLLEGWIPDEGPLAETTSFIEELQVGRLSQVGQFDFILREMSYVADKNFASWGAAPEDAAPAYLRSNESSNKYTKYVEFDDAEVVLRRRYVESGNIYRPDALFRLKGTGDISPRDDNNAAIKLNGVGKVSFRLGLSLPYDIDTIAEIVSKGENMLAIKGAGLSASVTLPTPTQTCAPSGYSVSYYLIDRTSQNSPVMYELRVSQIQEFPAEQRDKPIDRVIMELYKWNGGEPTRLNLANSQNTNAKYIALGSNSLSGNTYGLWVRADGRIAVGSNANITAETLSEQAYSVTPQIANVTSSQFNFALGSAECRPIFRYINRLPQASSLYSGSLAISPDDAEITVPTMAGGRGIWNCSADSSSTARMAITRVTPQGSEVGRIKVTASVPGTDREKVRDFYTTDMDHLVELTMGMANAELVIEPYNKNCNVFIDDLSVTSWCGNDKNRNGSEMVPLFTDEGFSTNTGFAGVGVWVRPEQDSQLTTLPSMYTGKQCLLMQRSRQNYNNGTEVEIDGIKHTGNAMALYMPYSDAGYGPVSFRYRIPQFDEYGEQGELPSVRVMLQFYDGRSTVNYLGDDIPREAQWVNVTDPIELRNTAGEWSMVSITPKLNGKELIDTEGTLRLVMVISKDMRDTDDPYVYLDDVRVTDNREGSTASWSATNVRVAELPVANLYWKDRQATDGTTPPEVSFAEKSSLTRGMQLNDTVRDEETEGTYGTTEIVSPILEEGVGRVTFAARLAEPQATPVRLYLSATKDVSDAMLDLQPITYVEVTNTVYTTYEIDLSKYKHYLTEPNPDWTPSNQSTGNDFNCASVRRLTLTALVEGDGKTSDAFSKAPTYGRVLLDQLSISNPVLPSIRVASVAFSNEPGTEIPTEFDARSPLSQPVQNASVLRTCVYLDRAQLLKTDSIRVFMTVDPHSSGANAAGSKLQKYTTGYEYTDVLGAVISADTDHPIYGWSQSILDDWPLSAWFDKDAALEAILSQNGATGPLTREALEQLGLQNTIELSKGVTNELYYYGELYKPFPELKLPENSLVRYNAWAVYQSEESDQWFITQIEADSYTEFPWYFPRNLNKEIREAASASTPEEPKPASFFSPYYWVYSYLPGEAFINEFNFADESEVTTKHFVEICAPANTSMGGWRVEITEDNEVNDIVNDASIEPTGTLLPAASHGVVPFQRKLGTNAQRAFYTVFSRDTEAYYYDDAGEKKAPLVTSQNAGCAGNEMDWFRALSSGTSAGSVRLHRPTGGAEHIVCFSTNDEAGADSTRSQANLQSLYDTYLAAYSSEGFGSEWYQTFNNTSWDEIVNADDTFSKRFDAKTHARRLVKADTFPADSHKDDRFALTGDDISAYVNDWANDDVSNSIAAVDMGGVFVTRKNAIREDVQNGPMDLTDIITGNWANINPTLQTRITEPVGGDDDLEPVVQVTPRQINPDQYLVLYSGFSASAVTSEIEGRFGSHSLDSFNEKGDYLRTNAAGRVTPQTWGLSQDVAKTTLTYTAFPFHTVAAATVRLKDASDDAVLITDPTELGQVLSVTGGTIDVTAVAADGWITITPDAGATEVKITTKTTSTQDDELRYSIEANATFALDPTGGVARDVITSVSTYCGNGSAEYPLVGSARTQPWLGNNFGFEVRYDDAILNGSAILNGLIITYPSPTANANTAWNGLKSDWTGYAFEVNDAAGTHVVTLEGMEYAEAKTLLNEVFMLKADARYAELGRGTEGIIADASVIATLGNAYATAAGYDGTTATASKKEPAIPYCVWGVYTVTLATDRGNEKVSFLMRQAMPGEKDGVWTYPAHYAPLQDINTGKAADETIPYFYLYSTPPQSAWLSELNLTAGTDATDTPFAEVTLPVLRAGILNDGTPEVKQVTPEGWLVRRYDVNGQETATWSVADGTKSASGSTSYDYYTFAIAEDVEAQMAYVLHRPCGAAEGGVWTGVTTDGGEQVGVPALQSWLGSPATSYVVPGVADAIQAAGSVQLIGKTVLRDGALRLSSNVADRTDWTFATSSKAKDNEGIRPDTKPGWNQVTITSVLKNNVYSGTPGGYQLVPGYFTEERMPGETESVTKTLSGRDWIYNGLVDGLALSYHPRATYRFESMTLPAELIGKVMLVGNNGTLSPEYLQSEVQRLKDLAAIDPMVKQTEWLTLGGRVMLEEQAGVPTGKLLFDVNFKEGVDDDGKDILFGNLDTYVISLVFVDEPSSAQNTIEVAFGQGETKAGAWLVTQTLYALKEDAGTLIPDEDKGGIAVKKPIWSDEDGNVDGNYANLHGWLYQPIVGDTIGMTTVINPALGLSGGRLGDPVEKLSAENTSLRPFLVWTAIPKSRIPSNLFDAGLPATSGMARNDFIKGWGVNAWIGTPSVLDGSTIRLSTLRQNLRATAASTASTALYSKAGIIPMIYQGYCDKAGALSTDPDAANRAAEDLLSFRTMTADELATAIANRATTGLSEEGTLDTDENPMLPYTTTVEMDDPTLWQDGAIFRFAVVIADAVTGYVYDCQSVSNFSSDALDAYCPWYIPDAQTNVNRATSATDAGGGVSPFAWVYQIPQGGVWINEFRPFAVEHNASAFELAMVASPLEETIPSNLFADAPATFTPKYSLDGWKVITRYAPMPLPNANPANPIEWKTHKEVPLKSWVPRRRIMKSLAVSTGKPVNYENASYELDYYAATVGKDEDPTVDLESTLSMSDPFYLGAPYQKKDAATQLYTADPANFQWLNFSCANEAQGYDHDLFNADLQEKLVKDSSGLYAQGVIYSLALVRNNGVIEDAVIFYNQSPYGSSSTGSDFLKQRMEIALQSENANKAAAGEVRALINSALPGVNAKVPAQFLRYTNMNTLDSFLGWFVVASDNRVYGTFSLPNTYEVGLAHIRYDQPYSIQDATTTATFATLSAHLTGGGNAQMELTNEGQKVSGRDVTLSALTGSSYALNLLNWDTAWYAQPTITRNGQAFTPVNGYTLLTTYAMNSATQTAATTAGLLIDSAAVAGDVDYNVVLTYTAEAQALNLPTELDEGFAEWLQQVAPGEVSLAPTGVELEEKYWLGVTSPDDASANPALNITEIGTYFESLEATEADPLLRVVLTNNGVRITSLQGDGNVVLLGKEDLSDADWFFIKILETKDLEANAEIVLSTPCKFFKAILLSDAEVQALITP